MKRNGTRSTGSPDNYTKWNKKQKCFKYLLTPPPRRQFLTVLNLSSSFLENFQNKIAPPTSFFQSTIQIIKFFKFHPKKKKKKKETLCKKLIIVNTLRQTLFPLTFPSLLIANWNLTKLEKSVKIIKGKCYWKLLQIIVVNNAIKIIFCHNILLWIYQTFN